MELLTDKIKRALEKQIITYKGTEYRFIHGRLQLRPYKEFHEPPYNFAGSYNVTGSDTDNLVLEITGNDPSISGTLKFKCYFENQDGETIPVKISQ